MKALSIQQPWASLIVMGFKDIENRTWPTRKRGQILVHAGKKFLMEDFVYLHGQGYKLGLPAAAMDFLHRTGPNGFPMGGIVGSVELVDCVTQHASPWFNGPYGFVLANPAQLELRPLRGQLGFFEVPNDADQT